MRHPPGIAYGLLVASLQAHATVAAAQDAGATALEEVVVTAQKRAENLQDIPIAVTAFTATDIERQGFTNVAQMAEFTPNVIFDTTTSISGLSSGAAVFIRGIGQIDFGLTTEDIDLVIMRGMQGGGRRTRHPGGIRAGLRVPDLLLQHVGHTIRGRPHALADLRLA